MIKTKLNIYSYSDYRIFLYDRLSELKEINSKYSRRYFIRALNLSSSNYLKRIIDGSRNLSDRLAKKLTVVLGLSKDEERFFFKLKSYNQAKTTLERKEALKNLRRSRLFKDVHKLDMGEFDYYSDPLMVALREMVGLYDFKEDPAWIASRLSFKASKERIIEALKQLQVSGHLVRDQKKKLCAARTHQSTGEHFGSLTLRTYHLNMLKLGADSIELPSDQRYFQGLSFSVPASAYDQITDEMQLLADKIRQIVDESEKTDMVYHMEMVFFPLTKLSKKVKGDIENGEV